MKPLERGHVRLVTPEGTELDFPLATVTERFIAFSFDFVVICAAVVACLLAGASLAIVTESLDAASVILLGLFAIRQGYFLFFEARYQGMTPGKRLVGLRVLSRDGGRLRMESIVARNVMRDLEIFVPLVVVAGPENLVGRAPAWVAWPAIAWVLIVALLPFVTRERTRAGDLVGGTVVVRIPEARLLVDEAAKLASSELRFERAQLAIYGEHELETLAGLLREIETGRATQDDLALVARTIAKKIAFDGPEAESDPATFLREFYRQQRAELERRLVLGKRKTSKRDT